MSLTFAEQFDAALAELGYTSQSVAIEDRDNGKVFYDPSTAPPVAALMQACKVTDADELPILFKCIQRGLCTAEEAADFYAAANA